MPPDEWLKYRVRHAQQRADERITPLIGTRIDMTTLAPMIEGMVHREDRSSVTFVRRVSRTGRRLWRVQLLPSFHFYAILAHDKDGPPQIVTVLSPGMTLQCEGRGLQKLR